MTEQLTAAQESLLRHVPLFAGLPEDALIGLARVCRIERLGNGETLFEAGSPGDRLYVIDTGEVAIWGAERAGEPVGRLGRGECLGEMALITGAPRSATITATRACTLIALDKTAFARLYARHTVVLEAVAHILCERLVSSDDSAANRPTVAVIGGTGRSVIAVALAEALGSLCARPTLLVAGTEHAVGATGLAGTRDVGRYARVGGGVTTPEGIEQVFGHARDRFERIIFDLDEPHAHLAEHCHAIVDVDGAVTADAHRHPVAIEGVGRPISQCAPYVFRPEAVRLDGDIDAAGQRLAAERNTINASSLRRLARKLLGRTVGLALGGGAAYGFAHAGVLQALDRHGFEVDLLAGTSAGAYFALAYAAGVTGARCAEFSRSVGNVRTVLKHSDPTLGRAGMLVGGGLKQLLNRLVAPASTFADLHRPAQVVATDVSTGEHVALEAGRLDHAFRASCSVPMLLEPVPHEGRLLVDGGMIDPVPVGLLHTMGADIVIAVNVAQRPHPTTKNMITKAAHRVSRLNPLAWIRRDRTTPSMVEIAMNAIEAAQYELGRHGAVAADLTLNPDLSEFIWTDFHRPTGMIERGQAAVDEAAGSLRRLFGAG